MHHGKRAVIFGGTGFVGRMLIHHLLQQEWQVNVVTRNIKTLALQHTYALLGKQVSFIEGSITDIEFLKNIISGADVVINLIGILYETPKMTFQEIHAEYPARLAAIAAITKLDRLIHISAIGADTHSHSRYAASKGKGEAALLQNFPKAVIIRPSIIIGVEDSFFNRFARMCRWMPALPLIGGGKTQFQPVFVGDVVRVILHALSHPDMEGKAYTLGGPKRYSFKMLMELLLKEIKRTRILMPLPFFMARIMGRGAGILNRMSGIPPFLTCDQVLLLEHDNVVNDGDLSFAALGIAPIAIEAVLPTYLHVYRKKH